MAYHHFDDPAKYTAALAFHLKPGGRLFVADLMDSVGFEIPDELRKVAPHLKGFSAAMAQSFLEGAGLKDVKYAKSLRIPAPIPNSTLSDEERMVDVFLAEGTKPAL